MKKILGWSLIAFLLFLIVQQPESATRLLSGTVDLLGDIARGAADVVQGVAAG